MFRLLTSKTERLKNKATKFVDLEKSLNNIESDLDDLTEEYQAKKTEYNSSIKLSENSFVKSQIESKYKSFEKSHLSNLGKIRKEKDLIVKSMNSLYVDDKEFSEAVKEEKQFRSTEKVLKSYRSNSINLSQCDGILKALKKDKVKYADNIVYNENGQILLLKRSEHDKTFAGMYVVPGGHVDLGEDCETAAKRELYEEAGIKVESVELVGEYEDNKVHIKYFSSNVHNIEPILQQEEAWGYEWVDIKDLGKYNMPLNMAENILKIVSPFKQSVLKIKKSFESNLIDKDQYKLLLSNLIEKALTTENTEDLRKESLEKKTKDLNNPDIKGENESTIDYEDRLKKLKKRRDPEGIEKSEKLKGGKADSKSIQNIAEKHNLSKSDIQKQVQMGIKIEMEHTNDAKKSLEIVKDHLWEFKDYYTRLKKMESEAEKSEESDLIKAWESAQIGETRKHKDGKSYKKVSNTGNSSKDWQLVTQPKNNKAGSDNVSKEGDNSGNKEGNKVDESKLPDHAKNTSEDKLNAAIKESDNPKVREAAQEELSRREKEEKPQEEGEKEDTASNNKEGDKKPDLETKEGSIDLTGRFVKADEVKTGQPVKITFAHNPTKNPVKYKKAFAQDLEPHGKYLINTDGKYKIEGHEYGDIEFKNPLVVEHKTTDSSGWKGDLVNKFGKKGKQLSKELIKRGYDGIITVDSGKYNDLSEIVSLKDFDENYKDKRKSVDF